MNADRSLIGWDSDSDSDRVDSDLETGDSDDSEELDEEMELEQAAMEDCTYNFHSNTFHNFKF